MKKFFTLFAFSALYLCVNAQTAITSAGNLSNDKVYTIRSSQDSRGSLYFNENYPTYLDATGTFWHTNDIYNADDVNCHFAILKSANNNYYLYSVATDKFVYSDGVHARLGENVKESIKFVEATSSAKTTHPWVIGFYATSKTTADKMHYLGLTGWAYYTGQTDKTPVGAITYDHNASDAGTNMAIYEVEDFDAAKKAAALDKIAAFESPFGSFIPTTLPFIEAADVNDLNAMYVLTDNPGNAICYDGTNINPVVSGNASNSDAFMFIKAGGGLHYIYDKTRGVYLSWSALSSSSNASTTANSVVKAKSEADESCKWCIIYDQASQTSGQYDIIPGGNTSVADNTHALNFRGGTSYKLNLYSRNDAQNKWRFTKIQPAKVILTKPASTITGGLNGKCVGTYASAYAAELPAGVTAYTAEMNAEKTTVTFTQIDGSVIPANTGVLLFAENEESVNTIAAPTSEAAASIRGSNAFAPMVSGTINAGNYVLGYTDADGVLFYPLENDKTVTNKAYISSTVNVSSFRFDFEEPTTGISVAQTSTKTGVAFDLAGRRINANTKGISIMNGHKVIR